MGIGVAGAQALAANTTLTLLNVIANSISDAFLRLLRNAIIRNIETKKTMPSLHAFASIANGTQAAKRLDEDIVWTIGLFLITDTRRLDVIRRRAAERAPRHLLFQPAGPVDPTIEPVQPAAPTNG